jgi:tetratricopeptide (TPR) repeat protein
VARWAAACRAISTAVSFAQAASFVVPDDGSLALEAGRIAAKFRRNAVAETWLRRAVALARRARDKAVYAGALLEHAWVRLQVAPEDGPAGFQRAIRAARRGGQGDVRALGHYGLARAAMARGDYHDAAAETHTTLRLLRPSIDNPHLPLVVLDHAEALLRAESPAAAAAALGRFLHTFTLPHDRVRALTLLVRTSRADGAPPVAEVWHEAVALLGSYGESEDAARGFLALGRAAAETRHDTHAENAVRRALAIATRARSPVLAVECTAFVDQLRGRRADG